MSTESIATNSIVIGNRSVAETESIATNSIVIGNRSVAEHENVFLFGDDLQSTEDNQTLVGVSMMGKEIPGSVRNLIEERPDEIREFAKLLTRPLKPCF